ncbi:nuclease-related domain-containing protein [Chryseoglobus sp. 28M-23]|uniref:nuclease-related domain-containing protein n=1 Tax=Chryseoglobus sp. 28M-23 TaxID=2772253 RepID=UPI001745F465|nr:nuclease-related domain-containing protein [Chryseoglobus sp. 28M-23]QOD92779.1 NERD domain-containing protein [Chryseoglobus sp. 28M-23]
MTDENGTAGGSARREYERRRAKDEAATRASWGKLGTIAVALTPERQSTRAWSSGAICEERVAAVVDAVAGQSIRVLHDRKIPRSKANIDHLVVTPGGVWVIDSKRYQDRRPELRVEGGILRPRVEKLLVRGSDKTALVEGVLKQVAHVQEAVGDVPVRGVLCFVDADWPLVGGSFTVRGVDVMWPKKLVKVLSAPQEAVCDVTATVEVLARRNLSR